MLIAALLATTQVQELHWEADALVHAAGRTVAIQSRTRLSGDGIVESHSWPALEGEAKGLRRMIINADGGWLERGGRREALPSKMVLEERRQYGFYLELQDAAAWCRTARNGVRQFGNTNFRCRRGRVIQASNWSGSAVQEFRLHGLIISNGAVFPRSMTLLRDRTPYFSMRVRRFEAR